MKNLRRALGMAFRYKWSLVCSTICAFLVAILWGANIGGVLPIIEIVFKGNSLHTMVDESIERSEKTVADAKLAVKEARISLASGGDAEKCLREINLKEAVIRDERVSLERTRRYGPWVKKLSLIHI